MNNKNDLRIYSDNELSLRVFNDETLYNLRRKPGFIEFLKDLFIFTDEQLEVLKQDLEDDENEHSS